MAASMGGTFDEWLGEKLLKINADSDSEVFVSYIVGILETETSTEEQQEALVGIISEITEDDIEGHCQDIVSQWQKLMGSPDQNTKQEAGFEEQIHSIVEKQQQQQRDCIKPRGGADQQLKSAILAQYQHVSGGEESDDDEEEGAVGGASESSLAKNMNALSIKQREQDQRVYLKATHDQKKQKDKDDREKQKQKVVDRKEGEKKRTQKGEKRR